MSEAEQRRVHELLEQAMKQPGVADVARLYEAYRPSIDAHAEAQRAIAPKWVFFTSTSSGQPK